MKRFKIIKIKNHPPLRDFTPTYTDISFVFCAKKQCNLLFDDQIKRLQSECNKASLITVEDDSVLKLDREKLGIDYDSFIIEMGNNNIMLRFYKLEYIDNKYQFVAHNINGNCFTNDDLSLLSQAYKWLSSAVNFITEPAIKIAMAFFADKKNRKLTSDKAKHLLTEQLRQTLTTEQLERFLKENKIGFFVEVSLHIWKGTLEQYFTSVDPFQPADKKNLTAPTTIPTTPSNPSTSSKSFPLSFISKFFNGFSQTTTSMPAPVASHTPEHMRLFPGQIELYVAKEGELAIAFHNQKERDNFLEDLNLPPDIIVKGGTGKENMLYFKSQVSNNLLQLTFSNEEQKTNFCAKFFNAEHLFTENKNSNNTIMIELENLPNRNDKGRKPLAWKLAAPNPPHEPPKPMP